MAYIQFTRNYSDRSNDTGYQFEFFCDRCGNGFMSQFRPNRIGMMGEAARGLGGMLGGVFGRAASGSYELQNMTRGKGHDDAFAQAVTELKPLFMQCGRCGIWACKNTCWNYDAGMCANCAPKREGEIEAAKSEAFVYQIKEKAMGINMVGDVDLGRTQVVTCPRCNSATGGAKFCPNCGLNLTPQPTACPACHTEVQPGTRFCPNCGNKLM